jgi:hypothetical protein
MMIPAILAILVLTVLLVLVMVQYQNREDRIKTRYTDWLHKRIAVLQNQYDNQTDLQVKISTGAKLKAHRDILHYIKTH